MIFKYLSCFSDYIESADLFSYCHMPIDTSVLWALEHWFGVPSIKSSYTTNARSGKRVLMATVMG